MLFRCWSGFTLLCGAFGVGLVFSVCVPAVDAFGLLESAAVAILSGCFVVAVDAFDTLRLMPSQKTSQLYALLSEPTKAVEQKHVGSEPGGKTLKPQRSTYAFSI